MTDLPIYKGNRIQLALGKYQVTRVMKIVGGFEIALAMEGELKLLLRVPPYVDIHEGDLLTLYTEVPLNAQPKGPPIK